MTEMADADIAQLREDGPERVRQTLPVLQRFAAQQFSSASVTWPTG